MATQTLAIGIDIGGTGIKGAVVDISSGTLVSDRVKKDTPEGAKPDDVLAVVDGIVGELAEIAKDAPVGICFPAVVRGGKTLSAANISKDWIGLEAEKLFEDRLGRDITFVNDADAAGVAESVFGAAKDVAGLVIMTTLGTGIGSALINSGILVPNAELGHLEIDGVDYETKAANSAREREDLDWAAWAERLQTYYSHLEALFSPDLLIVGGGISKQSDQFLPLLRLKTPIVPAKLRNNAGILGAATLAVRSVEAEKHLSGMGESTDHPSTAPAGDHAAARLGEGAAGTHDAERQDGGSNDERGSENARHASATASPYPVPADTDEQSDKDESDKDESEKKSKKKDKKKHKK